MGKQWFNKLAIDSLDKFLQGEAPKPVTLKSGLVVGGGQVYPEVNFTLPLMPCEKENLQDVYDQYRDIAEGLRDRAKDLHMPGFVAEIELMPPCTINPGWGAEIAKIVKDILNDCQAKYGTKTGVRLTAIDTREAKFVKHMYKGPEWDQIMENFRLSGLNGADLFSIESLDGKEVHDDGLLFCDMKTIIFSLAKLSCPGMNKLWDSIVKIAGETGAIPAGDTACGFANTAMVLAHNGYIPKVFGAIDRVLCAVRSLVAIECGATGPDKDCGYEGVYEKAIAGIPITMEGRAATCAHFSAVGNVAFAVCDLWSNESVQNIKLLSGMAPSAYLELLEYDCRWAKKAAEAGCKANVRDWMADSDSYYDPHAWILRPDVVLEIAGEMVKHDTYLKRLVGAAKATIASLRKGMKANKLNPDPKELEWLDIIEKQVDSIPDDEAKFFAEMAADDTASEHLNMAIYE